MIIYDEIEQGTPEWYAARAGIPTASNFGKIIKANGSFSSSCKDYVNQLVGERLLWHTEESYKNEWMQRGIDIEGEARELYEFTRDVEVKQVGFITKENPQCGCSPDGLVGDDGGLEIKCPKLSTHIKYLRSGKLPAEYHRQVHGSLYVTGRKWWDFMSYYPGIKPFIIRVQRDDEFNQLLEMAIGEIVGQIENAVSDIEADK